MRARYAAAVAAMAAVALTGCGGHQKKRTFYCTDSGGVVVAEKHCDGESGGSYYLWHTGPGGTAYRAGERVPADGNRFSHDDRAARESHGLPATGKVTNGTTSSRGGNRGGGTGSGK